MIITVSGGREKQRSLVESIVSHMADRILGSRLSRSVYCNFQIISNLDADGWCEWMDDNLRPREFSVQIRKEQSYSQMILTVVHEMVHVRQMARSELYEIFRPRQMHVWKGKRLKLIRTEPLIARLNDQLSPDARELIGRWRILREIGDTLSRKDVEVQLKISKISSFQEKRLTYI